MRGKVVILSCMILVVIGIGYFFLKSSDTQAIEIFGLEKVEGGLAALMHMPTEEQLALAEEQLKISYYRGDLVDEYLLILPYHKGSIISLYEISYQDDTFIEGKRLATYTLNQTNEVLYAEVPVPCGIPIMKIVIESEGKRGEYIISYDGKGDRPQIETIQVLQ